MSNAKRRRKYCVTSATLYADGSQVYVVMDRRGTETRVLPNGRPVFFAGTNYRSPETRAIQRAIARWVLRWGESARYANPKELP